MMLANGPPVIPILIGAAVLLPLLWAAATWNRLVRLRNAVKASWSGVDTELKRRHDLIPNLVSVVKGYAAHERQTLERVVEARQRAIEPADSPGSQARHEQELGRALKGVTAVVESYPDLKADQNYLELMRSLRVTEDRIQAARRFYNGNVRDLGNLIEVFPSNIIAGLGSFTPAEYFELEDLSEREVPKV